MMTRALHSADPGDLIQPLGQPQDGSPLPGAAGGVAAAGQPAGGAGRRGAGDLRQLLPDRLVQPGDLLVDRVDQPQVRADLEGVDVAEPAGQRVLQLLAGGLQPRVAERGQRRRAAFPGDQGVQEPAAAGPEQVRDHHRDLQQRVLEDLLHPGLVPRLVLGQPGPGAGQRPQVPDRLRRHERAAQHAPLVQLAVPDAVEPVAFAPPGQVLDVAGVDQPHLQPGRLGQVIPDAPVIAGALQHQPLDALAAQVVHQRGHLRVGGLHPPHLLPPAIRPAARDPGAHHPGPLGHVDRRRVLHHLHAVLGHLRAVTAVLSHRAVRSAPSFAFFFPADIAASLSLRNRQERGCPGSGAGKAESDRRARSDSTPARMIAPSAKLACGHEGTKQNTASRAARHDHAMPAGWTTRPASATLEPVTAPAGARAAHLSPQRRPVTTRSHHPAPVSREPHAAKTH